MLKEFITIDKDTGQAMDGVMVWVGKKKPSIYGNRWLQMSQDPLLEIAKDKELAGRPTRVLIYLLGRLDFENFIQVSQSEIAKELDLHRSDVSSCISLLYDKGILIKGPKVGRSYCFRLNPAYGWKGKSDKAKELQWDLIKGGKP
jgi:hypothetical protein